MEKIYHANMAILISGNVDFSAGSIPSNKQGYCIKMIQEDTILTVYPTNNKVSTPPSKT